MIDCVEFYGEKKRGVGKTEAERQSIVKGIAGKGIEYGNE